MRVDLSQDFEIERIGIDLEKDQDFTVIQGSLAGEPREEALDRLRERIMEFYQLEIENIKIWT